MGQEANGVNRGFVFGVSRLRQRTSPIGCVPQLCKLEPVRCGGGATVGGEHRDLQQDLHKGSTEQPEMFEECRKAH